MYYVVVKHSCFTSGRLPFETLEEAKKFAGDACEVFKDKATILNESGNVVYET